MENLFWPDLSQRLEHDERIDDPSFSGEELQRVVRHFRWINRWFGNYRQTRRAVLKIVQELPKNAEIHIVDVGCGGGDLMCHLQQRLQKQGYTVRFTGIDQNPNMIQLAKHSVCNPQSFSWIKESVFDDPIEMPKCQLLISSHFMYRLNKDEWSHVLSRWQKNVSHGMVFSELRRSRLSYGLFYLFSAIAFPRGTTRSDGLLAIRRAYRTGEVEPLLADMPGASVRRTPWFRQIIVVPSAA
ncbi:MAG: methyltransferase domain-containing protein [Cryomorphaceae bacterium]|nr:MAG: methyltransferase domain-containing protein [Cryomorphaceae bacterium]